MLVKAERRIIRVVNMCVHAASPLICNILHKYTHVVANLLRCSTLVTWSAAAAVRQHERIQIRIRTRIRIQGYFG